MPFHWLPEVPELLLICYESFADDEEASSCSRKRAAPSAQLLKFFLTSELGFVDHCSLESSILSSPLELLLLCNESA
jgi:hypothetical protein